MQLMEEAPPDVLLAFEEAQHFSERLVDSWCAAAERGADVLIASPSPAQLRALNGQGHAATRLRLLCEACREREASRFFCFLEDDRTESVCDACHNRLRRVAEDKIIDRLRQGEPGPGEKRIHQPVELPRCAGWRLARKDSPRLFELVKQICAGQSLPGANATYLDVACNTGFFCHQMTRAGYQSTGVDSAANNIEVARLLSTYIRGDFTNYVLADPGEYICATKGATNGPRFDITTAFEALPAAASQTATAQVLDHFRGLFGITRHICILELHQPTQVESVDVRDPHFGGDRLHRFMQTEGGFERVERIERPAHDIEHDLLIGYRSRHNPQASGSGYLTIANAGERRGKLAYDVAIYGAGPAGISLARALSDKGLRIGLFDAGGLLPPEMGPDHPYTGTSLGLPYDLIGTRLRYLGGSSNHWGGWCRPLDPYDFADREHIPLSGWPITRDELSPYLESALEVCEVPTGGLGLSAFDQDFGYEGFLHHAVPTFEAKNFLFSPPTRFGTRYRQDLQDAEDIDCILDATLVRLTAAGNDIDRASVLSSNGTESRVSANCHVLAMGAIENARMLLHSDIANSSDFVGRCFADHLGKTIGVALADFGNRYFKHPVRHGDSHFQVMPHLSFTEAALAEHGLANFGIVIDRKDRTSLEAPTTDVKSQLGRLTSGNIHKYRVLLRMENTPNPHSRITLSNDLDHFGVARVALNWQLNPFDLECADRLCNLLGPLFGAAGSRPQDRFQACRGQAPPGYLPGPPPGYDADECRSGPGGGRCRPALSRRRQPVHSRILRLSSVRLRQSDPDAGGAQPAAGTAPGGEIGKGRCLISAAVNSCKPQASQRSRLPPVLAWVDGPGRVLRPLFSTRVSKR